MSGIKDWIKRIGIYGYILVGIIIIVAAYFIIQHQAHLAAYSTLIFIVIFIGLHLLMHVGGHGSHGGQNEEHSGGCCGGSHGDNRRRYGDEADEEEEDKKGGSCH